MLLAATSCVAATFTVDSVRQRYPWTGVVDVEYSVAYEANEAELDPSTNRLDVIAVDRTAEPAQSVRVACFDVMPLPLSAGRHHLIWNAKGDGLSTVSSDVQLQLSLVRSAPVVKYMVVDLSSGPNSARYPVAYLDAPPAGGFNTDEYKTRKIAFRLVSPGAFLMGSPETEPGRVATTERQHGVLLTRPYYLALFELTLGQYRRIAGGVAADHYASNETQPLVRVPMDTFRGQAVTAPANLTPLAMLRTRTGLPFDLPTEAQWEHACRAGTTTPFSTGVACGTEAELELQMRALGRFSGNVDDPVGVFTSAPGGSVRRPAKVGCYPPNPWGFYDMHGNAWEMVRDRWVADTGTTGPAVDPCYAAGSTSPVAKGGSYDGGASRCRSAARTDLSTSSDYAYAGFRLALTLED